MFNPSSLSLCENPHAVVAHAVYLRDSEGADLAYEIIDLVEEFSPLEGRVHFVGAILESDKLDTETRGAIRKYFDLYQ